MYSNNNGSLALLAGSTVFSDAPLGAIYPYAGTTIPASFMLCDGTELLRTEYPALFAVIGTSFGTPSDDTKFKLPDLRGEFLRGAGTNSHSGQGSGGSVGTHQDATELPNGWVTDNLLNTSVYSHTDGAPIKNYDTTAEKGLYKTITATATGSAGGYGYASVRPTNTSVNFIIKALEIALPTDFEDAVDDKLATKVDNDRFIVAEGTVEWGDSGHTYQNQAYAGLFHSLGARHGPRGYSYSDQG